MKGVLCAACISFVLADSRDGKLDYNSHGNADVLSTTFGSTIANLSPRYVLNTVSGPDFPIIEPDDQAKISLAITDWTHFDMLNRRYD